METGGPRTNETGRDKGAGGKVVRLPRDWLGPRDELVPIDLTGDPERGPASPPSAEAFWSEHAPALHDAVRAPAAVRIDRSPADDRQQADPAPGTTAPSRVRLWAPSRVRLWAPATVALGAIVAVAALGGAGPPSARSGSRRSAVRQQALAIGYIATGSTPRAIPGHAPASTARTRREADRRSSARRQAGRRARRRADGSASGAADAVGPSTRSSRSGVPGLPTASTVPESASGQLTVGPAAARGRATTGSYSVTSTAAERSVAAGATTPPSPAANASPAPGGPPPP